MAKYTAVSEDLGAALSELLVAEGSTVISRQEVTVSAATAIGDVVTVVAAAEGVSAVYGVAISSTTGAGSVTAIVRNAAVVKAKLSGCTDAIAAALQIQGIRLF